MTEYIDKNKLIMYLADSQLTLCPYDLVDNVKYLFIEDLIKAIEKMPCVRVERSEAE